MLTTIVNKLIRDELPSLITINHNGNESAYLLSVEMLPIGLIISYRNESVGERNLISVKLDVINKHLLATTIVAIKQKINSYDDT